MPKWCAFGATLNIARQSAPSTFRAILGTSASRAGHGTAAGRSKASAVGASYSAFDLPIQCLNAAKENTDDAVTTRSL